MIIAEDEVCCLIKSQEVSLLSFIMSEHFFSKTGATSAPSGHGRRNYLKEEELIVRRRNAESDRHQLWTGVNDYFKTWDVRVNKFSNWVSPKFYDNVCDSRSKETETQKRQENLEKRRQRLSELLAKEEAECNEEIKNLRKHNKLIQEGKLNEDQLCHMNLELVRKSGEAARRENELRLYHHYTFPHPDQYRKQYAYFSKRAMNGDKKETVISDGINSQFNSLNKKWDSIITNDKLIAEKELLKSSNLKLSTDVTRRLKELQNLEEKKKIIKSEEVKRLEQVAEAKTFFKELMKDDIRNEETEASDEVSECSSASAGYLQLWKKKSKTIQNEIKQEIQFLDCVIKVAELVNEFSFKFEVEKMKQGFLKKLQMESGRERLSNLFECTYREPSSWWKEENRMWNDDKEEREKHLLDIYSKLETMEEKWNYKTLQELKKIVESQESIVSDLERLKDDIGKNEKLLEQLQISN